MKKFVLFWLSLFLASNMLQAADNPEFREGILFPFDTTVHQHDTAPEVIALRLAPGSVETVDLANGLQLRITTPPDPLEFATLQLFRRQGDPERLSPLHTVRQPIRNGRIAPNAYRVCGNVVSFFSPAREDLPDCPDN